MTLFEAILLGVLQGLTEFLPVSSSSGHLALGQHFLGIRQDQVFFDVTLHVGTLLAVVIVYRHSLARLGAASWAALRGGALLRTPGRALASSPDLRLLALLALGSLPTAAIGLLFKEPLEAAFERPRVVALMLIVTGVLLQVPRLRGSRAPRPPGTDPDGSEVRAWQALLIGLAQGLAITPGISRSGATISTGLLLGVEPSEAARYSFLLSIPAILGAMVLKLTEVEAVSLSPALVAAGGTVAFLVGWASLVLLLAMLRRGRFSVFSWYCFVLGGGALLWLSLGA